MINHIEEGMAAAGSLVQPPCPKGGSPMIITYKANMAGLYHLDEGIPCQDSFAVQHGHGSFVAAAVADGLGSETHSDIGSSVAANTAVSFCAEKVLPDMDCEEIKKILNNAMVQSYKAVLERAEEDGNDPDEYDTTLCLCVYDGEHLYYGHSGDSGLMVLQENGEYRRLTTQQRDEEGHVFPLCWGPSKWVLGQAEEAVSSVMLMTDGIFEQVCHPLLRKQKVDINIPLARKFMDHFDCDEKTVVDLEAAVAKYLEYFPRKLLDDDKTVVVLLNTDRKPAVLEEAYYAVPDWQALRAEAEQKLNPPDQKSHPMPEGATDIRQENDQKDVQDPARIPEKDSEEKPTAAEKTAENVKKNGNQDNSSDGS